MRIMDILKYPRNRIINSIHSENCGNKHIGEAEIEKQEHAISVLHTLEIEYPIMHYSDQTFSVVESPSINLECKTSCKDIKHENSELRTQIPQFEIVAKRPHRIYVENKIKNNLEYL